ncbi:MAG: VWA domain-containing protein [Bdellovibrio sp.]|nr:MAG: VWA domain-containing protein [Bdellovibrio sp.]
MPPPEKTQRLNKSSATPLLKELRPQLDVVFVLDNSRSMEGEIHSLQENIQKFIKGLEGQKGLVDYRIGVILTYDSTRYGSVVQKRTREGELLYYDKGEPVPVDQLGHRFVTEENVQLLKEVFSQIDISFVSKDDPQAKDPLQRYARGPEKEEFFSPLLAFLGDPENTTASVQKLSFLRPQAHLAVIIVTDADDSSKDTAGNLYSVERVMKTLSQAKGGDWSKLSLYGVLCPLGDEGSECRKFIPGGRGEEAESIRIRALIQKVARHKRQKPVILNLKSGSWGQKLSLISTRIRGEVLKQDRRIVLEKPIRVKKRLKNGKIVLDIQVKIGEVDITNRKGELWNYQASTNTVVVYAKALKELKGISEDSVVTLSYTPVDPQSPLARPVQ